MTDPQLPRAPQRGLAIVLALLGCGLGHFYAGLTRRAFAWFAGVSAGALVLAAALPSLGRAIGDRAAFVVFLAGAALAWVAPIVDVARLRMDGLAARPAWQVFLCWMGLAVGAGLVQVTLRGFFLEAFTIPSVSMMPTLVVGDHILIDKMVYRTRAPRRGEVMVFASPEHPELDFVKRVIAVAGDRLEIKKGHPFLNDWEVPHCQVGAFTFPAHEDFAEVTGGVEVEFLCGQAYLTFYRDAVANGDPSTQSQGPYEASGDESWVLGDNRNASVDSRNWFEGRGGGVPRQLVKGRPLFTWLNVGSGGIDGSRTGWPLTEPRLPSTMHALDAGLAHCLETAPAYDKTVPPKP